MNSQYKTSKNKAKIVQFSDEKKSLPDGSKVIYAESENKIVVFHKIPFEKNMSYVFDRKTAAVKVNGKIGSDLDKKRMLELGDYFLNNAKDEELITIDVNLKENT